MIVYDIDELAVIYDTLEFLNKKYDVSVPGIVGAKSVKTVKNIINSKIENILIDLNNKEEIDTLKKYILK